MSRLTYKLKEQEQEEHKTKYLKFEYFPIPDYCIEKGNYGRITSDMIYNKLGKLEDLEEQVGCPLEVRCKVVCDSYIYDENGIKYEVVYVYEDHFDCEDPFDNDMGYTKLCAFDWEDYKKDWFLKEDRSE